MKNKPVCLVIILISYLCSSVLHAQTIKPPEDTIAGNNAAVLKSLTLNEMQADYDILRKALEEAQGGLYRFSEKAVLDNRFDAYRKKIDSIKGRLQFVALLSELLAGIRDGHLRLEYDESITTAMARARLFPLRVSIEGSRIITMFNDSPGDSGIRPGMEILSINGHKVTDLIQHILPKLSGDGYIETGKRRRLERGFAQYYWLFAEQSADFAITAKDADGKIITRKLTGVLNSERENNRNNNAVNTQIRTNISVLEDTKKNVSLRFLNNPEIACLRVRAFEGEGFSASIDSAFRTLNDKKTKALILDLRGNGGGVDEYGALLVSYLTNKPFRYFDRIHLATIQPSFTTWKTSTLENLKNGVVPDPKGGYLVTPKLHSGVDEQRPASVPFSGKLFVLLDGGTFSTAADVTAMLRNLTNAIFIGEESGGAYEGNISGLNALLKLPNSKLSFKINVYEYWNAVSPLEKGRGTQPNYTVERRMADLLRGIDQPMNRAVELALTKSND